MAPKTKSNKVQAAGYPAMDRKYETQEAMRTLARADEIRRDSGLMRDVKSEVKRLAKSVMGKPSRGTR